MYDNEDYLLITMDDDCFQIEAEDENSGEDNS